MKDAAKKVMKNHEKLFWILRVSELEDEIKTLKEEKLFVCKLAFNDGQNVAMEEIKDLKAALEYVARHKDTASNLAIIVLDECATVAEQALNKYKGEEK